MSFDLCQLQLRVQELQAQVYNLVKIVNAQSIPSIRKDFKAGEVISGGKAVWMETTGLIYIFDITNPYHWDKYIGIAETSTIQFGQCTVVIEGVSKVIGQGWVAGVPYFIGLNAVPTSSIPPEGTLWKRVGVGVDNDTILINGNFEVVTI